jgi:hypothetical protein
MLFKTLLVTALVSLTSVHAQAAVPDPTTVRHRYLVFDYRLESPAV